MTTPRILDCTIRDGSYVVDFQFTAEDTAVIASGLDRAGVEWIEIGHGLGLRASQSGKGAAAASDDAYLQAAADTVKRAKWGMFFIPGIGRAEDLDRAAGFGMKFVRIGANAPEVAQTEPFVRQALKLGLHVSVNLMKSYVVPVARLVELSRHAESYGAQVVSLVDSAGTMLPAEVRDYVKRMRDALSIDVGFHGHDNLALGMANVLAAIEGGAAVVDTTLQGIGRGGGNPVTEILVAILQKQGMTTGIDLNALLDLSERVVRPLLKSKGFDPLNITSGYAGFHSSALEIILTHAQKHRIDPRQLIVEVSGINRVDVADALVGDVAAKIAARGRQRSAAPPIEAVGPPPAARGMPAGLADAAIEAARQARSIATRSGRTSVFNLVAAPPGVQRSAVSSFVQEEFDAVIASAQIADPADIPSIVERVDGGIDVWFVDADIQPGRWSVAERVRPLAARSRCLAYRDNDTWARAVERQIAAVMKNGGNLLVVGADPMALRIALALGERGSAVAVLAPTAAEAVSGVDALRRCVSPHVRIEAVSNAAAAASTAAVVVAFARESLDEQLVASLPDVAVIFDAGIGALGRGATALAAARGLTVIRPDMRAVLAAEISAALGAERATSELMGRGDIAGVPVVAGGVVGHAGDVVIDSISNPSRAIGVANGEGGVDYRPSGDAADRLSLVQRAIWRQKLNPEIN